MTKMKSRSEYVSLKHEIPPEFSSNSKILILGSFPSVLSRENGFFYGNPKNRFWRVLANCFGEPAPESTDEKKAFLKEHRIAVWDVIASCSIKGSGDSSIKNVAVNDISRILDESEIETIITNGKTADKLYKKYLKEKTKREAVLLPSTSPANASYSLERLTEEWKHVLLG